jgi:hypothetical protein
MTTATEKMTWSQWNKIICSVATIERWKCCRALNQRPDLVVILVGRVRYRSDRKVRTTLRELNADGWMVTR